MEVRCSVLCQQVCSNDNKTFDSSCHFFATKCTLEGTKKGHKLHLDYIGPCKCESPERASRFGGRALNGQSQLTW